MTPREELSNAAALLGAREYDLKCQVLSPAAKAYIEAVDRFVAAVDRVMEER